MNKDLKFIARSVEEWPNDEMAYVRLDADGEICFSSEDMKGSIEYDFFHEEGRHNYTETENSRTVGHEYTRHEYENARESLYSQNRNS